MQAQKVARPDTPSEDLRIFAKNIGSNYFLKDKQLTGELKKPFASLRAWAGARATDPKVSENFCKVTPAGFEPAIFWMRTKCPRPLDDGAMRPWALLYQIIEAKRA